MITRLKMIVLSLSLIGSLFLMGTVFLTPVKAQTPVRCVAVCDPNPCLCTQNQSCVIWVSPTGGPCLAPNTNCWPVCIGPQ